jgi:ferredoxin-NADP reductase
VTDLTLRLAAKRRLTDRISEFRFEAATGGALPGWEAGAHLKFALPENRARAYSLISFGPVPDAPDTYAVAVQREEAGEGGSMAMHGLQPGDTIGATAPKCDFAVTPDAPAVLLAGGIGVTPLISMVAALKAASVPVVFHFSGRSRNAMAYLDALGDLLGDDLQLHFDDEPATALDLDAVVSAVKADQHLYICGPRGMIDAARAAAERAGIPPDRVHVELFENTAAGAEGDQPFEVELASSGEVFTIPPGKIHHRGAGSRAGHDLMYDCQRGDCGICQTDVIAGIPDHRDVVLSAAERASGKVMQICVSRAKPRPPGSGPLGRTRHGQPIRPRPPSRLVQGYQVHRDVYTEPGVFTGWRCGTSSATPGYSWAMTARRRIRATTSPPRSAISR